MSPKPREDTLLSTWEVVSTRTEIWVQNENTTSKGLVPEKRQRKTEREREKLQRTHGSKEDKHGLAQDTTPRKRSEQGDSMCGHGVSFWHGQSTKKPVCYDLCTEMQQLLLALHFIHIILRNNIIKHTKPHSKPTRNTDYMQ